MVGTDSNGGVEEVGALEDFYMDPGEGRAERNCVVGPKGVEGMYAGEGVKRVEGRRS